MLQESTLIPSARPPTIYPTRRSAIMNATVYDSVNATNRTQPLTWFTFPRNRGELHRRLPLSRRRTASLSNGYPKFREMLDDRIEESLARILERTHKRRGTIIGRMVAERILALQGNYGSNAQPLPYYTLLTSPALILAACGL
jgi:hypothetical protein